MIMLFCDGHLALEDMAGVYGLNSNISETDSDYGIKKAQQIYVSW